MSDQEKDQTLLSLGMYVGVYVISSLLAEHEKKWGTVKRLAADEIQSLSGMPAEDFALKIDGLIDDVLGSLKKD